MTAPVRHPKALSAFAALLDHSIDRIAELAGDARNFDRTEIYRLADVWDNNTVALFNAATARTRWSRELRARLALRWLADLGDSRRAWVVERTAAAGFPAERFLLPPDPSPRVPFWYEDGHIVSLNGELTPQCAADLAAEYDLPAAELRRLMVERGATLNAQIRLGLPRRYSVDRHNLAELTINFDRLTDLRFDSADATGLTVACGPDGVTLGLGAAGTVRGESVSFFLDDADWWRSPTGRRQEAEHPARSLREPRRARHFGSYFPSEPAGTAAGVLRAAMLGIRMVGHGGAMHRAPVLALATALTGAGTRILEAGAIRNRAARTESFRALVDEWFDRGGADFAREICERAYAIPDLGDRPAPGPAPAPLPPRPVPSALLLLRYGATHTVGQGTTHPYTYDSALQLQYAQPSPHGPDHPWHLSGHALAHPVTLRTTLAAFTHPAAPTATPETVATPHLTATGHPEPRR